MQSRIRAAGLRSNDYIFGMNDSGHMTAARVCSFLANLPDGLCEIYSHPATHTGPGAEPPDYDFAGELQGLIDPAVVATARNVVTLASFTTLATDGG